MTIVMVIHDFRPLARCMWGLRSSGMLRIAAWKFRTFRMLLDLWRWNQ